MKRRHIGFLLCLGLCVVQAPTVPALAADFTCQVYGGSFVLDDSDFKALDGTITREQFVSLEPTSNLRISICNTRKLWRLIKNGKAGVCDFTVHYKGYNALYFDDAETDKVMAAQTKAAAQGLADKLAGTPKKCQ